MGMLGDKPSPRRQRPPEVYRSSGTIWWLEGEIRIAGHPTRLAPISCATTAWSQGFDDWHGSLGSSSLMPDVCSAAASNPRIHVDVGLRAGVVEQLIVRSEAKRHDARLFGRASLE